eukprot:2068523-Rhodomonas_salina.1
MQPARAAGVQFAVVGRESLSVIRDRHAERELRHITIKIIEAVNRLRPLQVAPVQPQQRSLRQR